MAIKIQSTTIIDDSRNITNANSAEFTGNTHVKLPIGTTAQRSASPAVGMLRYNTTDGKFEGYTTKGWGSIGGGGFDTVSVISTNTAANNSTLYVITAAITLTLPASPATGDLVGISNRSGTSSIIIARNTKNIMSLAEDLTVDVLDAGFTLVYTDTTRGWVII
jgi:hypothetical protein